MHGLIWHAVAVWSCYVLVFKRYVRVVEAQKSSMAYEYRLGTAVLVDLCCPNWSDGEIHIP